MKQIREVLLGLLIALPLYATQSIHVSSEDTIDASISPHHLNRIYLVSDRIQGVKALDGQFQLQHDETSGELYIKPTITHIDETLHLYIRSENGFSYALVLIPDSETPQTIALRNAKAQSPTSLTGNNKDEIHQLLNAMHEGKGNDDIIKQDLNQNNLQTIHNQLAVTLVANYWGQDYVGEVLTITHDSRKTKILHESELADEDTLALVLLSYQLERAQFTYAYRIKRYE